jgi:hypothetical protein
MQEFIGIALSLIVGGLPMVVIILSQRINGDIL